MIIKIKYPKLIITKILVESDKFNQSVVFFVIIIRVCLIYITDKIILDHWQEEYLNQLSILWAQ
jgi:hypothetical protein